MKNTKGVAKIAGGGSCFMIKSHRLNRGREGRIWWKEGNETRGYSYALEESRMSGGGQFVGSVRLVRTSQMRVGYAVYKSCDSIGKDWSE